MGTGQGAFLAMACKSSLETNVDSSGPGKALQGEPNSALGMQGQRNLDKHLNIIGVSG